MILRTFLLPALPVEESNSVWYVAWANGISMCLSVFAQLTVATNTQTDVPLYVTNFLAIVRICAGNAMPANTGR